MPPARASGSYTCMPQALPHPIDRKQFITRRSYKYSLYHNEEQSPQMSTVIEAGAVAVYRNLAVQQRFAVTGCPFHGHAMWPLPLACQAGSFMMRGPPAKTDARGRSVEHQVVCRPAGGPSPMSWLKKVHAGCTKWMLIYDYLNVWDFAGLKNGTRIFAVLL